MTFTETPFLVLFPIVYGLWLLCRKNHRAQLGVMLTASLVFYGYHQRYLLFVILAYCLVDWAVGYWIEHSRRPRMPLTLGVAFNLLVLGYWKYTPLLLRSLSRLALAWDLRPVASPPDHWLIPFGISFYAFTGIAYMVDVYRRTTPAETNFWRYTLSVTFFPHLVAGPILRATDFLNRLRPECMPNQPESPLEASLLLARGFFKKMVLADRIALAIDPFFVHVGDQSTAGVWSLPYVYLYALQIYFDFSAYTDIARGLGLLFGFRWPDNFNLPYLACSATEFWRRWHITLSLFLRDYLYIPLGGNRRGRWRTYLNLMMTMLLGGLWHGASWSFMLWGGLHGVFLVVNRLWESSPVRARLHARPGLTASLWRLFCIALTFQCVCLAWCFFRLNMLSESLICVYKWFVFDADKRFVGGSNDPSLWILLGLYGMLVWMVDRSFKAMSPAARPSYPVPGPMARGFLWGCAATLVFLAVVLSPTGTAPPFIYFRF